MTTPNLESLKAEGRALMEKATPPPWGHGDGCCGPFIDYQARPDERSCGPDPCDYDGREPIWLGGSVDQDDRTFIAWMGTNAAVLLAPQEPGAELTADQTIDELSRYYWFCALRQEDREHLLAIIRRCIAPQPTGDARERAERIVNEGLNTALGCLNVIDAAANRCHRFYGDPNLDVPKQMKDIQAKRLEAHKALVAIRPDAIASAIPLEDVARLLRECRAMLSPFYFTTPEHAALIDRIDARLASASKGGG